MEYLDTYPGFQIVISHTEDGDFQDGDTHPECIRSYRQEHGIKIHTITKENKNIPFTLFDGIYTREKNITIGCLSADCPVVIFMGRDECAIVHSGWRGTRLSIVKEVTKHLSLFPDGIKVYIGPHIQDYEVGSEFREYFDEKYLTKIGEKYILHLALKICDDIESFGISRKNIEISTVDTFKNTNYQSYRRAPSLGIGYIGVKMH